VENISTYPSFCELASATKPSAEFSWNLVQDHLKKVVEQGQVLWKSAQWQSYAICGFTRISTRTSHISWLIHTYVHTYIHIYHFIGPQFLSYNSRTWNLSEKTHNTQTKQTNTIQYNKQMSILQCQKSNTVHK
jgi:hypothetical protein